MGRGRRVALVVAGVVLLLGVAVAIYLDPIAPTATGYAAKIICSGHFVADRAVADVTGDLPDNPLRPFLRTAVDAEQRTVTSTLLGAWGTTAWHTEGLGCTLAQQRPELAAPPPVDEGEPGAPWPAGDGPTSGAAGADEAALDAALDRAFVEGDPEGRVRGTRAVVVAHRGELIAERYAEGFGPATPLLGWSMTKSVANAIVGRLVLEGVLDVGDDALLPVWQDDDRAAITLDHLLHMASGLAFDETYEPGTDVTRMLFRPSDTGAYAAGKPLEAEPGTRWSYSSGTSNILCDVAQRASGQGPELARDLVFAPLGMASAVLEPDASGGLVCSSFLYATARDWARFGQWFLQDGVWDGERLLPEGWVARSTTPVELDTDGTPYGAQWWLNEGPDGELRMPTVPADAFWAAGNEGQQVLVVPSAELVVVRLGLSSGFSGVDWGLEPLAAAVLDALG